MNEQKNNVCLLIASYDGGKVLWNDFFKLWFKYWPTFNYPIYSIAETEDMTYNGRVIAKALNCKKGEEWSNRMLSLLKSIPEEFILITLDDYYLDNYVNLDDYYESLKLISENKRIGAIFYDMHTHVKINKQSNKFDFVPNPTLKHHVGKANMQMGLWRKTVLLKMLRKNESAQEFEYYGSIRAAFMKEKFLTIKSSYHHIFYYGTGWWGGIMARGHLIKERFEKYKGEELELDYKTIGWYDPKKHNKKKTLGYKIKFLVRMIVHLF